MTDEVLVRIGAQIRDCLDRCDIDGIRKLWRHIASHLPQPNSDFEVQVMIHRARTESQSVVRSKRHYSHQWLLANGLPSGLPESERPRAERRDFKFAYGVGISMVTSAADPESIAVARLVQKAMGDACEEAAVDGRLLDADFVRERMGEAKARTIRSLGR